MDTSSDSGLLVLVCREEFTEALEEEIGLRAGTAVVTVKQRSPGFLVIETAGTLPESIARPMVFERQRIEGARWIEGESLKSLARDIMKQLMPAVPLNGPGWTCHVFVPEAVGSVSLSPRAKNLEQVLLDFCHDRFPRLFRAYLPPDPGRSLPGNLPVLNLCVFAEGVWGAVMDHGRLSDPRPGGIHRMAFDRYAPSRSYLKIEEALSVMGTPVERGQTVVDLGASPGGWSYAFLKRGCRVTAVDNGRLRIEDPERHGGRLTHLQQDGTLYQPDPGQVPVDWLVSDMLISTGTNLWVLRKWFTHRWMRRFVVNIKLPQQHPYPVLKPIEDFLNTIPGIRFSIRQLYHDRREVTLFGELRDEKG